jgi:hypothetical protein
VVDGCLKLSFAERACTSGGGDQVGSAYEYGPHEGGLPPFVIVEADPPGHALRVTTAGRATTAGLHGIPGSGRGVGLAFDVDGSALAGCGRLPRVEVLDDRGAVLSCVGG